MHCLRVIHSEVLYSLHGIRYMAWRGWQYNPPVKVHCIHSDKRCGVTQIATICNIAAVEVSARVAHHTHVHTNAQIGDVIHTESSSANAQNMTGAQMGRECIRTSSVTTT